MKQSLFTVAFCLFLASFCRAQEPRSFAHPDRIRYDAQCLTIDGKDTFIYSGAFHYFRCPKELWRDRFQKFKEAGFNAVETYIAWNWHEREMPKSPEDFSKISGLQDLDDWLTMAEEFGFYVIIRPGPYICAEWDNGGFPRWLSALEKPAEPLRKPIWLRTDDPVFLAWSKHWLDAVCPVIAKHQITHKAAGQPGIILFQIENEYDYVKLAADAKVKHLTTLAEDAKADGIDVPLFTCNTHQIREAKSGPLREVFDSRNFYPRWNVKRDLDKDLSKLRSEQPDAMLMTVELQGGWFSEMGGKLSEQQEGVTASQIQNITLYAWQSGETLTNYYMGFGGTNFDDWGARKMTTSYDYNAPVREHGGVDARYQRAYALGQMIREHGSKLVRSEPVQIEATTTDSAVQIAERRAKDGSRYFFVRTDDHAQSHKGNAHAKESDGTEFSFDFDLEPFGSLVLYLPSGVADAKQGEWLPKPAPEIKRPTDLPASVNITTAKISADPLPAKWTTLQPNESLEAHGVFGSHFLYYKIAAQSGTTLTIHVQPEDSVVISANGKLVHGMSDKGQLVFTLPPNAKDVVALYENLGHVNFGDKLGESHGILSVQGAEENSPLQFFSDEREHGLELSRAETPVAGANWKQVSIGKNAAAEPDALLAWYRMQCELPGQKPGVWVPWHLHLEANGNGFIYVNGHCLGRYWQVGPQHDFYIPETWLNFGKDKTNVVALDLRPVDKGMSVQSAQIAPDTNFAEFR